MLDRTDRTRAALGAVALVACASCNAILGLGDFEDETSGAGAGGASSSTTASSGGAGGASSTTTTTTATTTTTTTSTTTTTTGAGGAGGEGGSACTPNDVASCYDGPAGTEGAGICKAGVHKCKADGSGFEPCNGQTLPGVESCADATDSDCVPDCAEHQWSRSFGDVNEDYASGVASDAAGNVYVTGTFAGTVDFGGGPLEAAGDGTIFVLKLDTNGKHVWSKVLTTTGYATSLGIAVGPTGNVVLTGAFSGTVDLGDGSVLDDSGNGAAFVAQFDPAGHPMWSVPFGSGGSDFASGVAVDPVGNVFLVGSFVGPIKLFNPPISAVGGQDIFVARFDPSGVPTWFRGFGSPSGDFGEALAVDAAGSVYATGLFRNTVSFGGGPITAVGDADTVLLKLDSLGNHVWSRGMGATGGGVARSIAIDPNGRIALTGSFGGTMNPGSGALTSAGSYDIYVALYKNDGTAVQAARFGAAANDSAGGAVFDSAGNLFLNGAFAGTIDFGGGPLIATGAYDSYLVQLDPTLGHLWSRTLTFGAALALDKQNSMLFAGSFFGDLDLGGVPLHATSDDILVAKLAHPGLAP